ncbi:Para-aminobenzoate synthase glutamine amidotransferase component II [Candidatus Blochmanniella chromaiodes str. 640]|uniref:Para-aminobenzoate synthase glutamine amidotransferase component II n=1 Tax=Candidatus Blochmanniella chromaiodes str. 640 TaxID=1240471 RepID=A0ABN4AYP0_9ENTR|nr:aminodeoxychorismate/anthranilate synthase component II [Candidatus Blochmannia chromaiodes]AGC03839.1 Para-aminobenzoate synthase glutamine amidotransferase component II [Candidatus Blochmannia chromaiodes str. 640]
MNKILIIDNYDSFTWNLYQYFREMGAVVEVRRNDALNIIDIEQLSPERLVISPGPSTPDNAGISLDAIYYFHKRIPILGVCLGHQAIAQFFGAKLKYAQKVMHGKISLIHHNGSGIFTEVTQPLNVVRYHSLVIDSNTMPSCLEITAWSTCNDKYTEIMGIRHRNLLIEGVQFHPESILSEQGHQILGNFMKY